MPSYLLLLVSLGLLLGKPTEPDLGQLQEMLYDRQDGRGQSQAALMLLQSEDPAAEKLARHGLKIADQEDAFVALAVAVRMRRDTRFVDELFAHLGSNKARIRQVSAETIAGLADTTLVQHLDAVSRDARADARLRQAAIWTLGRSGRQDAARCLVVLLSSDEEETRRVVAAALMDLSGLNHGTDTEHWNAWWGRHKDLTEADWLQQRLSFQTTRAGRLDGELLRARTQVLRLHQQVYARLSVAERLLYIQTLVDQDEPGVRGLSVIWSVEMLPSADGDRQKILSKILLRLTLDSNPEVQRAAVLGLGRCNDVDAFERLKKLLESSAPLVRAAAIRALSVQARGNAPSKQRLEPIVPLLQKALEDKSLEVVVEAAETLGALGAPEAGPVLTGLLRHPSEHVRQTVAQALERMAEPGVIDGLLRGLDDPGVTVRFSLLGALARAAGNGQALPAPVRKRVCVRLEMILHRDNDPGVRGRAATVLGECGDHEALAGLWRYVLTADGRVQEKAWDAFVEILIRTGSVPLVETWDKTMTTAKQSSRRLQLWGRIFTRWEQTTALREPASKALEGLITVQLELGKWASAGPLVQGMLVRGADLSATTRGRCLAWAAQAAELALSEGNRPEAMRLLKEARPSLPAGDKLIETYDRLEKLAGTKP